MIGEKLLNVRSNKMDGFISICDEMKCLIFLGPENYDAIYHRIKYLVSLESDIRCIFSHYYGKIKADSYESLPIKKRFTL